MKKKIIQIKPNKWKLKNKWDMEDWFSIILAVLILILILVNIMR